MIEDMGLKLCRREHIKWQDLPAEFNKLVQKLLGGTRRRTHTNRFTDSMVIS